MSECNCTNDRLFTFGLIGDIQYANRDNGNTEGRVQRYREAPLKLDDAVRDIKQAHCACVVVLGDTIDGCSTVDESKQDVEIIAKAFDKLELLPVYHVIGNHDLCVTKSHFCDTFKLPSPYYRVHIAPNWLLIVLDTTDMSRQSEHPMSSLEMAETLEFQSSHPIETYPHMFSWNGGLCSAQRRWLDSELSAAKERGDRVIVASHNPLSPICARETHLAWNWWEIRDLLVKYQVDLVLAGHDHEGGYACVDKVHFVTVEAMLEAPSDSNAYAFVDVYDDKMVIRGQGTVKSRILHLAEKGR